MSDDDSDEDERCRKRRRTGVNKRVDDSKATRLLQIFIAELMDPQHDCKNPPLGKQVLQQLNDRLGDEIGACGGDDTGFFVAGADAREDSKQEIAASIIRKVQQITGAFPDGFPALS